MSSVFPPKFYIRFACKWAIEGLKFKPGEVASVDFQIAYYGAEPGFVAYIRTLTRKRTRERCMNLIAFDDLFSSRIVRAMSRQEYEANRYADRDEGVIDIPETLIRGA